ncbi:MAG: hypothetical protein AB2535_19980 [Candidatus Thiodiazotropha endolucinida]
MDLEHSVKTKAYYDGLTGLPNRHLLFDCFGQVDRPQQDLPLR